MQCRCQKCQGIFEAEQEWVGRQVECPFCHQVVTVQPIVNPQTPPAQMAEGPQVPPPAFNSPMVMASQPYCQIAGIGVRFLAAVIDGLILGAVNWSIQLVLGVLSGVISGALGRDGSVLVLVLALVGCLLQVGLGIAYEALFIAMKGATPGKMIFHLKVQYNGQNLTIARSLGRVFAKWLSSFICMIGYIMAFFNPEHKALHDQLCDTRVVVEPR